MGRYCQNCGQQLRENTNYCPRCGRPVRRTSENNIENKKEGAKQEQESSCVISAMVGILVLLMIAAIFIFIINKEEIEEGLPGSGSLNDSQDVYGDILDEYQNAAKSNFNELVLTESRYINEGVWNFSNAEDYFLYYQLKDLSEDRIPELIISVSGQEEIKNIVDIYTVEGGEPVRIISNDGSVGYRTLYWICEDNRIKRGGFGGVNYETYTYYRLERGDCSLTTEEQFIYDSGSDPPYTYVDSEGSTSEITESEFMEAGQEYDVDTDDEWTFLYSVSHR